MNKKIVQTISITDRLNGKRLDFVLSEYLELTRSQAQKAIKNGEILVNDQVETKPKRKLASGDRLIYQPEQAQTIKVEIPVLFEDDYLFVINKPSGITVHPAPGEKGETVIEYFKNKLDFPDLNERDGVVHRLDKGTSGVMLIAKNPEIEEKLKAEFKNRTVNKTYVALIEGALEPREGEIDIPIGRDGRSREKMTAQKNGKSALTLYRTLESFKSHSLLELNPKTGRTHQLRVHLTALGHPIVGDLRYGGKRELNRIFLHAQSIEFIHPMTGEQMKFTADLPSDLKKVLEKL